MIDPQAVSTGDDAVVQFPIPDGSTAIHEFFRLHLNTFADLSDEAGDNAQDAYGALMGNFLVELAHEIGWLFSGATSNVDDAMTQFIGVVRESHALHNAAPDTTH